MILGFNQGLDNEIKTFGGGSSECHPQRIGQADQLRYQLAGAVNRPVRQQHRLVKRPARIAKRFDTVFDSCRHLGRLQL